MARPWHVLTVVVCAAALLLQLVLVVSGDATLTDAEAPPTAVALGRFVSYFTIQSNLLVLLSTWRLARTPSYDGPGWRVLRLAALVGITVTGLVHFVLLRPLLDLDGASWVADKLLHMAVPLLAVVGWALVGPRPRITWHEVGWSLVWPVAWLAWTLTVGGITGWYPYPFLNPVPDGWGHVALVCVGITVLFVLLLTGARSLDRRLRPAPAPGPTLRPPARPAPRGPSRDPG